MSVKETERKAESRQRRLEEKMRNDLAFMRCGYCRAYVRRTAEKCWKCGEKTQDE